MFLPARMARVLLGGHQDHLADAVQALHDAGVVHLEDYRDDSGLTHIGTPLEAGDELSGLLLRTRGLQKSIDSEGMAPRVLPVSDPLEILSSADEATHAALEELHDARAEASLREAERAALEPFAGLDFDLAAVAGLRSVRAFVGTARQAPALSVPAQLEAREHGAGVALALFVRASDAAAAEAALQAVGFSPSALPSSRSGTPDRRLAELAQQSREVETRLAAAEARLAALRETWGPRLANLEQHLAREVDKTQAPLRFGVTERTFHVEGWVPRGSVEALRERLKARFGNSIYVEELGDAPSHGHGHEGVHGAHGAHTPNDAQSAHGVHGAGARAPGHGQAPAVHAHEVEVHDDGGHHDTKPEHEPPVHLQNPKAARPYEFLLGLLGRPRYKEIDPTPLLFIFFPLFFGLMVGDVAVGLAIALLGVWLKRNHIFGIGGPAVGKALLAGGIVAMVAGLFVFGEALGIHFVADDHALEEGELSWESILYGKEAVLAGHGFPHEGFVHKTGHAAASHAPTDPGMVLHAEEATAHGGGLAGLLAPHSDTHLSLAGVVNLGYYSKIHDVQALLVWSALIGIVHIVLGLLIGFRNVSVAHGATLAVQEKLSWLGILFGVGAGAAGLAGGSTALAAVGFGLAAGSIVLLWMGTAKVLGMGFISLLELPSILGNILSYTRLAAIGASKAGIVIAIIAIADLLTTPLGPVWWAIYILGMVAITLLATLSGGLQSLRLQFVEFFQKFYTGGGRPYVPFGRRAA